MPPRLIYHFCLPVSKFRTENPDRAFKDPPSHGPGTAGAPVRRVPGQAAPDLSTTPRFYDYAAM